MAKQKKSKSPVPKLTYNEPAIVGGKSVKSTPFEIVGTAPLIMNKFSEKSIHQMLRKHMNLPQAREAKVPRELIEAAIHRNTAGAIAIPSTAIKKSILAAASATKTFAKNKVALKCGVFIRGASIPITFKSMTPRMDIVRNSGVSRVPDVRFRPQFNDWSARFVITYDEEVTSLSTIIDLIVRAGYVGLCEWRPEKSGDYGTFEINSSKVFSPKETQEILNICKPALQTIAIPDWALEANLTIKDIEGIVRGTAGDDLEEEVA